MDVKELHDENEAREYIRSLSGAVVLDLETTGLNPRHESIIDIGLCELGTETVRFLRGSLAQILAGCACPTIGHNVIRFDFQFLRNAGVAEIGRAGVVDTLLLHHLIDENDEHSLDSIIKKEWNDPYKEEFWGRYQSYQEAPREAQLAYAAKDLIYTGKLYSLCVDRLLAGNVPESLARHVHELALALLDTETKGLRVNVPYVTEVGVKLKTRTEALLPEMRATCGIEIKTVEMQLWQKELEKRKTDKGKAAVPRPVFSFDSSKQVANLLYSQLNLPVQKNQKTWEMTVDDQALENLEHRHPVIPMLREYRENQKLYGSFIEGTLERAEGGRIYPGFNVNGTVTGRLSSSNPNLQQLPRQGGIRAIYIPDEGEVFISADYSQLEVSIAAHFTQDKNLLKIVLEGASQHDITAEALGIPRQLAKTVNFASQYRCGPRKLAQVLDCSQAEGQAAFDKYWETYSGMRDYIAWCDTQLEAGSPIYNPFGRARHFPRCFENKRDLERAKRQVFNALVQGTGADLTNRAYYLTHGRLKALNRGRALFPIHDEVLISVVAQHAEEENACLKETMEACGREIGLSVPLKAEPSGPMPAWLD